RAERAERIAIRIPARTGRLAGQATLAAIDVRLGGRPRKRAFKDLFHQDDSSARRIHFLAQFPVRRTSREAKSTMDTSLHRVRHRRSKWAAFFTLDRVEHEEIA